MVKMNINELTSELTEEELLDLEKAKSLGKGYTSVLSRLLDLAINDEEMLRKCL